MRLHVGRYRPSVPTCSYIVPGKKRSVTAANSSKQKPPTTVIAALSIPSSSTRTTIWPKGVQLWSFTLKSFLCFFNFFISVWWRVELRELAMDYPSSSTLKLMIITSLRLHSSVSRYGKHRPWLPLCITTTTAQSILN